ncbi:MAG: helix-turn-helix domain-containing protein [Phycicoccus sp.]|nr:helix-turn-helix domain-containing protein [Phycicoccus sp.]NMM35438.1 helix-turn-helix domain-containing protein [Phycicoccus sp.]
MHSAPLGRAAREVIADVSAVASLDEPTRRRIYDHVGAQEAPVSRDDVAVALDVPRRAAAFHLDRLAELGLLAVSYGRRTGRTGPGAGRPAKLYQRSTRDVAVSLPPRDYDLAGRLLAGAMAEAQQTGERPREVLGRQARDLGRSMAAMAHERSGRPADLGATSILVGLLEDHGFEPRSAAGDIILHNCPFHALAQEQAELVCGMNLQLLVGVLEGLGTTGLQARLEPGHAGCCVRLEQSRVVTNL